MIMIPEHKKLMPTIQTTMPAQVSHYLPCQM
jgi:hypothetical protein